MSALLEVPTLFRFMNNPCVGDGSQEFVVANNEDFQKARKLVREVSPEGVSPLIDQVYQVSDRVKKWSKKLIKSNQKVVVVIATDGLPTDSTGVEGSNHKGEFIDALKCLLRQPVWLVIRLCTGEHRVVSFYNNLDYVLEASVEVLDDLSKEAREINKYNNWLNYTLPLHRSREMGFKHRLFDLLDERKLTSAELREYCVFLFGKDHFEEVPDPEVDLRSFVSALKRVQLNEKNMQQWNFVKKTITELVDTTKISKQYRSRRIFSKKLSFKR